jgi:hypothetical protein
MPRRTNRALSFARRETAAWASCWFFGKGQFELIKVSTPAQAINFNPESRLILI